MRSLRIRPHGFTLMELLVVISIISLLISILLPALGAARRSAQNVQCLANLRQVGVVNTSYVNDYKGLMPPASHTLATQSAGTSYTGWPATTDYYMGYVDLLPGRYDTIMVCPTYRSDGIYPRVTVESPGRVKVSYTYNMHVGAYNHNRDPGEEWWRTQHRMEDILKPSRKAYLIDGLHRNATWTWYAAEYTHFTADNVMDRHPSDGNNMLYFDGHASGMPGPEIIAIVDDVDRSMWRNLGD